MVIKRNLGFKLSTLSLRASNSISFSVKYNRNNATEDNYIFS